MEWISVKDKLPIEGSYLVFFYINVIGLETSVVKKFMYAEGYFDPETGWSIENKIIREWRHESGYTDVMIRVTHWMPLPQFPKE